ncbi:hypothetical protein [Bacillus coahuilensis]|uniref:hypothetical protein n=1 Tax=Bacillus coahuilensis TaxID=408580 RepID=UPI0012DC596B|nr:hypothetical protein [Bacillus coahuilensis]
MIKNPSQPGPSNYGTPSGVSKSKPSTKKTSGGSVKKLIQTGLDYGGYIPGPLGAVADGVNALIYLADGDYKNAALSGMAVLPGGSAVKSGIKAGGALGSVAKGNSNALAKYDVKFATSNLIRNGKISVDDLKSMIPKNTPNTFRPSETIKEGYKYKFEVNGQKVEVKWHSPDLNAKQLYPNSNSGNMWTAQVKIGKKLLGQDGNLYKKPNNLTHIPIQ